MRASVVIAQSAESAHTGIPIDGILCITLWVFIAVEGTRRNLGKQMAVKGFVVLIALTKKVIDATRTGQVIKALLLEVIGVGAHRG